VVVLCQREKLQMESDFRRILPERRRCEQILHIRFSAAEMYYGLRTCRNVFISGQVCMVLGVEPRCVCCLTGECEPQDNPPLEPFIYSIQPFECLPT